MDGFLKYHPPIHWTCLAVNLAKRVSWLGQKAEGALEGAHQNVKYSQAHLSSKQDVTQMFRDMYGSMYFVQAPSVRRFEPVKQQYSRKAALEVISGDDELFNRFIVGQDEDYVQQLQF